jgi:very-short-patch-repair endonuclease
MLTCLICNAQLKQLHQHLKKEHLLTVAEYRTIYNYTGKMQYVTDLDRQKRSILAKSGNSILNVNYWIKKGFSIEDAKLEISKIQSNNTLKREYKSHERIINIDYWIQRHGYSVEDARLKVAEIQSTRSRKSSKFFGKTHSIKSKHNIGLNMSKHIKNIGAKEWSLHFGKFAGRSKCEIECYTEIKNTICNDIQANVNVDKYVVDMIYKKLIIEFNGDYWHCNPLIYQDDYFNHTLKKYAKEIRQNDLDRQNDLHILGYNILVIWEHDWKTNKLLVLEQIKKFLNDL